MEAQRETRRFTNQSLKQSVSQTGYKLLITPESKRQIEGFQGYERVQIDKTIQYLASVPRPAEAGEPVIMLGYDHYRRRNGCCMIDYTVLPGEVTVTRVIYKKVQPPSGKIIAVKGNLDDLPKDVRALLDNAKFWRAVHGGQSRMKHFRLTGENPNQTTGAAIYAEGEGFRFGDVSESAVKGYKYGSNAILGGGFAGNSQAKISGAVAVVLSHPKWMGADQISRWDYFVTAKVTNALILAGTRDRIDIEYVLYHVDLKNTVTIRDERRRN